MIGVAYARLPVSFRCTNCGGSPRPFPPIMRSIFQFTALVLLVAPLCCLAEKRPDDEMLEREIGPALKHVGDFALADTKGEIFAVGRILVDVTSIYTVLAQHPEAGGECEFMYSAIKHGQKGKGSLHRMRYRIQPGKSTILFNTDVPGKELALEFDFDPAKEFAEGIIRKDPFEVIAPGTFRLRFQAPTP
jgi:hypothetical protein